MLSGVHRQLIRGVSVQENIGRDLRRKHKCTINTSKHSLYFCLFVYNSIKGKVRPRTDHEGPELELTYSSNLSLTSTLDGGECQCHAQTSLLSG